MPPFIDLTGQTFGRLTALEPTRRRVTRGRQLIYWRCDCSCGNECFVRTSSLRRGNARSCRCLQRDLVRQTGYANARHRRINSGEYGSWRAMLGRCYRANHPNYVNYGARGVVVDERWRHSFLGFYLDMGPRPPGTTLDRIDVDGNYEPGNCRWATWHEQRLNQRRRKAA